MSERDEDDFELDGHALAMIAAYRQEESLPADVQDRVWDRVESDVAVPAAAASMRAKWGVVLLVAAAAIAAVVIGAQAVTPSEEKAGSQQAPYGVTGEPDDGAVENIEAPARHVEREPVTPPPAIVPPPAVVPPIDAAPGAEPTEATPEGGSIAASRPAKPRARRAPRDESTTPSTEAEAVPAPEPAAPVDTLAEETRMLRRAKDALSASRPNDALAILDECRRKFPSGRLAPERAALRVIALCDADRGDEGSRAADAFLAEHSGHALASRVRRACDR